MKPHAPFDSSNKRKSAANGEFYFVLQAINGKTIGRSKGYRKLVRHGERHRGGEKNAPGAAVADLT